MRKFGLPIVAGVFALLSITIMNPGRSLDERPRRKRGGEAAVVESGPVNPTATMPRETEDDAQAIVDWLVGLSDEEFRALADTEEFERYIELCAAKLGNPDSTDEAPALKRLNDRLIRFQTGS